MPRSYQKLFRQQTVHTNINGKPLPVRVTNDQIGTFFISLPIWYIFNKTPLAWLFHIWVNEWVLIFLLSFFTAWAAHKIDPDGKPLPIYLKDAVKYVFRSKVSNGWVQLPRGFAKRGRRMKFRTKVKHSWTDLNVPLPAATRGRHLSFESGVYFDVVLRNGRVDFREASRLRFPSRTRFYGLRPGRYQVRDGKLEREYIDLAGEVKRGGNH